MIRPTAKHLAHRASASPSKLQSLSTAKPSVHSRKDARTTGPNGTRKGSCRLSPGLLRKRTIDSQHCKGNLTTAVTLSSFRVLARRA